MIMYKIFSLLAIVTSTAFGAFGDSLEAILYADHPIWYYLLAAFSAGLLVSFTPCIYPMIPITASIIHPQATGLFHSFLLSCSYVFGMAAVYASLGFLAALGGEIFGAWLGNPFVIGFIVAFLVYMALATLGFYELHIPSLLSKLPAVRAGGSYVYTFLAGALSGTIASPCVSPALFALLTFVAMSERPVLGLLLLFVFALGMSMILLLVGTFSGFTAHLPRAGYWMVHIKNAMGFILLGTAVSLLLPFIRDSHEIAWYGAVVVFAGIFYWYQAYKLQVQRHMHMIVIGSLLVFLGAAMILRPLMVQHGYKYAVQVCGSYFR